MAVYFALPSYTCCGAYRRYGKLNHGNLRQSRLDRANQAASECIRYHLRFLTLSPAPIVVQPTKATVLLTSMLKGRSTAQEQAALNPHAGYVCTGSITRYGRGDVVQIGEADPGGGEGRWDSTSPCRTLPRARARRRQQARRLRHRRRAGSTSLLEAARRRGSRLQSRSWRDDHGLSPITPSARNSATTRSASSSALASTVGRRSSGASGSS